MGLSGVPFDKPRRGEAAPSDVVGTTPAGQNAREIASSLAILHFALSYNLRLMFTLRSHRTGARP